MDTGKELTTEVKQGVTTFVGGARELVIRCEADMIVARDAIRAGRALTTKITEWFEPMKKAAKAAHQAICDKEKAELLPIAEGTEIYNKKITNFQVVEKARLAAETARLEEIERKKREAAEKKANDRINALADKCLGANEQIVALQSELNNPEITDDEVDIIQARISSLIVSLEKAKSDIVTAQAKAQAAAEAPASVPPVADVPKVAGVGGPKVILNPVIMNPYVLLQAVVNKTIPISILDFNIVKIKRLVNEGMQMPGVVTTESYRTNVR